MGQAASAKIVYGIDIDPEDVEDTYEIEEIVKSKIFSEPAPPYFSVRDRKDSEEYLEYYRQERSSREEWYDSEEGKEWCAWHSRKLDFYEKLGAGIEYFGATCDYADVCVCLNEPKISGSWGGPEPIDPASLVIPEGATEKLRQYCELAGVPYQDPEWLLLISFG